MAKKRTHEDFVGEILNLTGNEYTVLGTYKNAVTKVEMVHNKCGNLIEMVPNNFIHHGKRCKFCAKNVRLNYEEVCAKVNELTGDEYKVIAGEYKNNKSKLMFKHNLCGYVYESTSANFINNNKRCPKCAGNLPLSQKDFNERVEKLVGDEYVVVGKYVNRSTKLLMKHMICGKSYQVTPGNFLEGRRCSHCFKNEQKTPEQFRKEVQDIVGDEYTVLGSYQGAHRKLVFKHNVCGLEYEASPRKFLSGRRCPKCKVSLGESGVREFLTTKELDFREQVKFPGCKLALELPFDFVVYQEGTVKFVIEYDGEHHFNARAFGNGLDGLNKIKERDAIKNKFCKEMGYNLVRIPYWEKENINIILEKVVAQP